MLSRTLAFCGLLLTAHSAMALTIYKYVDANGVVTYTDKAAPGAQVFVFRDRMVEHLEQQVHLQTSKIGNADVLSVNNELYAPVEVELNLEGVGNVIGAGAPIRRVVPPRQILRLAMLSPQNPGLPLRYTPKFRYALGDPGRQPVPYLYPLPWRGGPFRMSQGPNGKFSHFGPKSRYAIDIAMPPGTPIIAARAGTVVKIENGQASGSGGDPSGNFVRILHDDGTMGVYLHLTQGSVQVLEGQRVAVGTPLARSGNTGNSSGPHLHFVVQRNVGLALESIPYDFNQPVNSLPNFAVGANGVLPAGAD